MNVYTSTVLIAFVSVLGIQYACAWSFPNLATLKNDAIYFCCGTGTPIQFTAQQANDYISSDHHVTKHDITGIWSECCDETCDHEEVQEGSAFTYSELGEECVGEGCSFEEISHHCPPK